MRSRFFAFRRNALRTADSTVLRAARAGFTTLALVVASFVPAMADVSTAPVAPVGKLLEFRAIFTPQYGVGEIDGTLRIKVTPSGIVSGSYVDSNGRFSSVGGGMRGKEIWLDIGPGGNLHVEGTYAKNAIHGYSRIAGKSYNFTARPGSL
jgi:hypothetical protein